MKRKNTAGAILATSAALLLICSFSVLFFYPGNDNNVLSVFSEKDSPYGILNIKTADAETLLPVEDAVIYLPSEKTEYLTKSDGTATGIQAPVADGDTVGGVSSETGSVDVLIYAEGYPPHAYLDIWIDGNRARTMTLLLHRTEGYFAAREAPNAEWITEVLEENKP